MFDNKFSASNSASSTQRFRHALLSRAHRNAFVTRANVARRGSVAGRRFPVAALGALEVAEAVAGVELLAHRALVSGPADDDLFGASYVYRHALLRDAGYASLARADRVRLHVQLARWLEQRGIADGFDLQRRAEEVPVAQYLDLAARVHAART